MLAKESRTAAKASMSWQVCHCCLTLAKTLFVPLNSFMTNKFCCLLTVPFCLFVSLVSSHFPTKNCQKFSRGQFFSIATEVGIGHI